MTDNKRCIFSEEKKCFLLWFDLKRLSLHNLKQMETMKAYKRLTNLFNFIGEVVLPYTIIYLLIFWVVFTIINSITQ